MPLSSAARAIFNDVSRTSDIGIVTPGNSTKFCVGSKGSASVLGFDCFLSCPRSIWPMDIIRDDSESVLLIRASFKLFEVFFNNSHANCVPIFINGIHSIKTFLRPDIVGSS